MSFVSHYVAHYISEQSFLSDSKSIKRVQTSAKQLITPTLAKFPI